MPQVLKAEVRERIALAALGAFARKGYEVTTMNDIAHGAGVAVANLYRYYGSKDELFEAVVPRALVARFEDLLDRSVHAHAGVVLARPSEGDGGRELLELWVAHRLAVVILLDRASGSIHAGFAQRFVERLVTLSLAEIRAAHPGVVVPKEARLVLQHVFENTRRMIGAILESCEGEGEIRRAVGAFRAYQVAGLAAFTRWLIHAPEGR